MTDVKWKMSEVISFLETKVLEGSADEKENLMLEMFYWDGRISKKRFFNTYLNLISEMNYTYNN